MPCTAGHQMPRAPWCSCPVEPNPHTHTHILLNVIVLGSCFSTVSCSVKETVARKQAEQQSSSTAGLVTACQLSQGAGRMLN